MLLESKFQKGRGVDTIFSTKTPVEFGRGDEAAPKTPSSLSSEFFRLFSKRLKPVMKVRDAMDKVYSKGYFEQHYPDTDRQLKSLLHDEAQVAKQCLNSASYGEIDNKDTKKTWIVVQINLGDLLGK